jgi:GntR family transcriptional regulator/MocR family aminotransferase
VIIHHCFINSRTSLKTVTACKEYQFAIIEDDYDYDFQFEGLAMLPMASSDANGMVIYLGKLGQSYFQFSNRICSSPENLISEAKNYLQMLDRQGDLTQEQMLSNDL